MDWGVASMPCPGEAVSGDAFVAQPFPDGFLLAAVDGLGHGAAAAAVANACADVLAANPGERADLLVARCHRTLLRTRGASLGVLSIDIPRRELSWVGVGDVTAAVVRADPRSVRRREILIVRNGIVGAVLPATTPARLPLRAGDTIVLATDGVRSGHEEGVIVGEEPRASARRILDRYHSGNDDALVLVARFTGAAP